MLYRTSRCQEERCFTHGVVMLWVCAAQIDKTARRQLAVMRWQHARAVLACEHKQSLMKLPAAKAHTTLQQVCLLMLSRNGQ